MCAFALAVGVGVAVAWNPLDLGVYRFGGRSVLHGFPLYDGNDPATGYPFTYPPVAALLFVPVALLPGPAATALWVAASVVALALTLGMFLRQRSVRLSPVQLGGLVLLASVLYPVRETYGFGQVNLFIMCAVCVDLLVLRGRWTGLLIGLAAGIKLDAARLRGASWSWSGAVPRLVARWPCSSRPSWSATWPRPPRRTRTGRTRSGTPAGSAASSTSATSRSTGC